MKKNYFLLVLLFSAFNFIFSFAADKKRIYTYEESVEEMSKPYLMLDKENREFQFFWSMFSSYIAQGTYEVKDNEIICKTEDGNSVSDYDPEEIRRGQSIYTSVIPVEWKDCKINFIDTPGYLDYEGEMRAGLTVADNALIVVGAKEGVESGTEKAWKAVSSRQIPTIFFINKIEDYTFSPFKIC